MSDKDYTDPDDIEKLRLHLDSFDNLDVAMVPDADDLISIVVSPSVLHPDYSGYPPRQVVLTQKEAFKLANTLLEIVE
jgi:hypothetical protein